MKPINMELFDNLIADRAKLDELCNRVGSQSEFAVDTEFTRIRTFRPRLELVQLATPELGFCVDAARCPDLTPLLKLLRDPNKTVVMHAASQDLEIFAAMDAIPDRIFDTQIAARFCGFEKLSYKAVVEKTIGVSVSKGMTRSNWGRRPLSARQIRYALDDVRYLIPVYRHFRTALDHLGRIAWHTEECASMLSEYRREKTSDEIWTSFRRAAGLPVGVQHRVRALLLWREGFASKINLPRQWVISDDDILSIASAAYPNRKQVADCFNPRHVKPSRCIEEVMQILKSSPDATSGPVWLEEKPLTKREKNAFAEIKQVVQYYARKHDLPVEFLCTSSQAKAIVRGKRDGPVFSGWRKEIVADAVVGVMSESGID